MLPFQVLNLPKVALQEILKCFTPIELFDLSLCSQKTFAIIELAGAKKFKLEFTFSGNTITINDEYLFQISPKSHQSSYENLDEFIISGSRKFQGEDVTIGLFSDCDKKIMFFWENGYAGKAKLFIHLSKIFNCPTFSLNSHSKVPRETFISCIEFIASRQKKINNLCIQLNLTDQDLKYIFDNLKVIDEFSISQKLPEMFHDANLDSKSCVFWDSSWVSLEKLIAMRNVIVIYLYKSCLTNQNVDQFIQKWKCGEMPNLQYLMINSVHFTEEMSIQGLDRLWVAPGSDVFKKVVLDQEKAILDGVDIQRNDGTIGKFKFDVNCKTVQLLF